MWEARHNNADWDCFRTLTSQEILKIQNQQQEEFCVFSEVIRSCQKVGCARNGHQFHTGLQKLNLFLLVQVHAWIEHTLLWDLVIEVFPSSPNQSKKTKEQVRGDSSRNTTSNKHTQNQTKVPIHLDNLELTLDESTRRLVATEEDQEHLNFPEDSKSTRRLAAPGNSDTKGEGKFWPHNFQKSTDCVPHMEKGFSIVIQRCGLRSRD